MTVRSIISNAPVVSVVITTYNRSSSLSRAMHSVLGQRSAGADTLELIVVDNNSTDDTRMVVQEMAAADPRVRYVFEPRQGSSFGRNAGIHKARGPIVAFTDDDICVGADWVESIRRGFRDYPRAAAVGGRVLPIWPAPPPLWLTRDFWAPLALIDYGNEPIVVAKEHPICLVTANAAFRSDALAAAGGFAATFQLGAHGILGSVEDHELELRLLRAGLQMVYDPRIVVHAEVQPNRLERAYHRRWHTGHGHFHAMLRSERMEDTRIGTLFGVPAHMYRQALADVIGWTPAAATGDRDGAFRHELRLRFFGGFFRTRRGEFLERPRPARRGEVRRLLRSRVQLRTHVDSR